MPITIVAIYLRLKLLIKYYGETNNQMLRPHTHTHTRYFCKNVKKIILLKERKMLVLPSW